MKYKATLTLSVEAESEDDAKQELINQVGADEFDRDSIVVVEEEE